MLNATRRSGCSNIEIVKYGLAAALLCGHAVPAAATSDDYGIAFGSATLLPVLRTELRYDDNIFESADNKRDSKIALLMPSLTSRLELGNSYYELGYSAESAKYFDSADDDYLDHNVLGVADMQISARNNLSFSTNFAADHEDRGTGLSEGFNASQAFDLDLEEPDEYEQTDAEVRYTYGAPRAAGRLALNASYKDLEYQNHRQRTAFRDREASGVGAAFYYRILPNTSLLVQVSATAVDYSNDRPQQTPLDSDVYRYLLGAEWDNSERLSGAVKIGYQKQTFAAANRDDFAAPGWEVDLTWSPHSYSRVNFKTERGNQETNSEGDFIDVKRVSTEWTHDWSAHTQTRLELAYVDEKFENFDREEQLAEISASVDYRIRRWLTLRLDGVYRHRRSNLAVLDFNRRILSLGFEIAI